MNRQSTTDEIDAPPVHRQLSFASKKASVYDGDTSERTHVQKEHERTSDERHTGDGTRRDALESHINRLQGDLLKLRERIYHKKGDKQLSGQEKGEERVKSRKETGSDNLDVGYRDYQAYRQANKAATKPKKSQRALDSTSSHTNGNKQHAQDSVDEGNTSRYSNWSNSNEKTRTDRQLQNVTVERDRLRYELDETKKKLSDLQRKYHEVASANAELERKYNRSKRVEVQLEESQNQCQTLEKSLELSEKVRIKQKKYIEKLKTEGMAFAKPNLRSRGQSRQFSDDEAVGSDEGKGDTYSSNRRSEKSIEKVDGNSYYQKEDLGLDRSNGPSISYDPPRRRSSLQVSFDKMLQSTSPDHLASHQPTKRKAKKAVKKKTIGRLGTASSKTAPSTTRPVDQSVASSKARSTRSRRPKSTLFAPTQASMQRNQATQQRQAAQRPPFVP